MVTDNDLSAPESLLEKCLVGVYESEADEDDPDLVEYFVVGDYLTLSERLQSLCRAAHAHIRDHTPPEDCEGLKTIMKQSLVEIRFVDGCGFDVLPGEGDVELAIGDFELDGGRMIAVSASS